MIIASQYPTRLLIRCPTCAGTAVVTRDDYAARQVFCALDGVPMQVVSVTAGVTTGNEWPHERRVPTTTIARCACVPGELAIA